MTKALASLEPLRAWEKLESLSERFGLPHVPEHDLGYFRTLFHDEVAAALSEAESALARGRTAARLAERGRLRRLAGDAAGAVEDLRAALDLEPKLARAHAWLGELDLTGAQGRASLERAAELDSRSAEIRLYLGAALMLAGDTERALKALDGARKSALASMLAGLCEEKLRRPKRAAAAYARAARLHPVCSAAHLLRARLAKGREAALHLRRAYDVSPVLGFITLQIHRTYRPEAPAYVKRILKLCFEEPETVGAYYKREATQTHFSHFPAEDYGFVEKLVRLQPDLSWANAFYGRAACYTPDGAPEGVRHLTRAIRLRPEAGWAYAWRANARRLMGQRTEALADFGEAVRRQPYYHRAFVWRASLLRRLGRFAEAAVDLDRAAAMDPHYSLTFYERSMTQRALGDYVSAALDLDTAFLLDHRYSWVFKTGGEPTREEFDKGLAELDSAVAANPGVVSLLVWRGQLKLQRRDVSGALLDLTRACGLDPHHLLAHAWHGRALLESGRPAEAEASLRTALKLDERFFTGRGWLAEALWAGGKRAQAETVVREVLKAKPKTPWAHYLLARSDLSRGRAASAIRSLERALLLDGKYPEAYLLLAQARLASGDAASALKAADRCLAIAPNLGRAYIVRAAVYEKQGRAADVLADYRRALEEFPYLFNDEERARISGLVRA